MKKTLLLSAAVLLMTSCGGKLGNLTADHFTVVPNPLEAQMGNVPATINATFPEKYMNKKAVITVTPELRFEKNGTTQSVKGNSQTFQGEKVVGNNPTVSYLLGSHYTMKSQFAYQPEMQKSDLYMTFDARIGKKAVQIPAVHVAKGVIATSELYHRTVTDAQACIAPDAFQRVTSQKLDASVRFLIQQADLRKSELKNNSVQEFVRLLQQINNDQEGFNLDNVEVSAYASPDGGVALNEKLATKRQENTQAFVKQQMKQAKVDSPINARYTAQDWDGFQELVKASNIQDKEVILRVLSMYTDPEEREQQIKNMSQGFRELADGILPQLRRARMTINYEVIGRDDEQILSQLEQDATKLSVEELLYAATLKQAPADQKAVYLKTTEVYPQDARAYNNIAAIEYAGGNDAEAKRYLEKAAAVDAKNAETNANLGLLALKNGNTDEAETFIGKAANANGLAEALGNLHLAQGNYALAAQDFNRVNSNSAALAHLLNSDYAKAEQTLKAVKKPNGTTDYLRALVSARQGNTDAAAAFLRSAIEKDPSLAKYAAADLELSNVNK